MPLVKFYVVVLSRAAKRVVANAIKLKPVQNYNFFTGMQKVVCNSIVNLEELCTFARE